MWSLLLKLLESIGSIRMPLVRIRSRVAAGNTKTSDALGTGRWRNYLDGRALSKVWGPHLNSPWAPFHCLPLFVAIDYLKLDLIGPCEKDPWPVGGFETPDWLDSATLVMVDLPGPQSAALGAALAGAGCDLVCTFNNWPAPNSVVYPENTLAALLRYASWLEEKRVAYPTPGPAAWLCDADRLGAQPGRPGQWDNRYYIEDSVIPGPNYLRERGISKIVYISEGVNKVTADLAAHLHAFKKDGLQVGQVTASVEGVLHSLKPFDMPEQTFKKVGFFRSSAGGFGAPVPHPSSGG